MKAEILRLDADVVTLIEMGPNKRRILGEMKDRYPLSGRLLSGRLLQPGDPVEVPHRRKRSPGDLGWAPYIRAKLGAEAGGITVFGVHTIRFPHSRAQFRQANAVAADRNRRPATSW